MSTPFSIISHGTAPPTRGKYVIAVPGQLAPIQRFDLPNRVAGAARVAVARQQLADRLGAAAQGLTVVPLGGTQWNTAVVCETTKLQEWCDTDAARSPCCIAVLPDMLTLPSAENAVVLKAEGQTLLGRGGASDGFACPLAVAAPLLERMIADGALTRMHTLGDMPRAILDALAGFDLAPASEVSAMTSSTFDLRRARDATEGADLRLLGAAVAIALLALGLYASSLWIETRALRQDAVEVRRATTDLLREGLIPNAPILDIRQQVTQAMARRSGEGQAPSGSVVDLVSRASVLLFGTGIEVGAMAFEPSTGALAIDVRAESFTAVDQMVATLNDSGLDAVALDMRNANGGGVAARLRLQFEEVAQ